jgi:hypothetical protein
MPCCQQYVTVQAPHIQGPIVARGVLAALMASSGSDTAHRMLQDFAEIISQLD